MRILVLILPSRVAFACSRAQPNVSHDHLPRALSLHLADYCDKPMADRLRFQRFPDEVALCAERAFQLDDRDFSTVSLGQTQFGMPAIKLCLNESGRGKLQRLLSANVGRWIVFLSRGKLLMAAKIMSADVSECAMIEGHVSPEDVQVLERAIHPR